ncbi:hypothetical protein [Frigoribacterium sp. 9N]|jgi:hypothetical protein|uniref:hypothetical protein n=1 Tax=Frigoribacterium sp. 9N TaxID=2653144 RepID=UPI0012F00231|nr:hypothetical protein [Frigoribacterium sp. 9N]VXB84716.1 conserved hypothetical protein [Frigoribacterium sp. 9N]
MRTRGKDTGITVGGAPRVDLLPPEVRAERRAAALTRRVWGGVVVVAVVVGIGSGAAFLERMNAEDDLMVAQGETQTLLMEQGAFADVRSTQAQVSLAAAAQTVGGSTDIDWPAYLEKVQATLPVGVTIVGVSLDQASPLVQYAQPTAPLQGSRVATLTFQATSPTLPSVPDWLNGLATLPGFADAQPGSVTLEEGTYKADVTMHITADAFSGRFAASKDE